MKDAIRFDDSLPAFAGLVKSVWGEAVLADNLFLRDGSGRLAFVVLHDERSRDERADLAARAVAELYPYVDLDGFAVVTPDDLFDDGLRSTSGSIQLSINCDLFEGTVNLIDRRMVGADWLRKPEPAASAPARFVFASTKGGVGRSTALCVLAAKLANEGRRVLAIDMDLEAPGLGNLLLPGDTLPEFGLLDYLVELEAGSEFDEAFFADIVGHSWLGGGRGRVDVIPAIGNRSLRYPANVLAKLARAYLAGLGPEGKTLTFYDHIRSLVDRYASPLRYDSILVDARAGLHETTAAALAGLGAEVLLFGLDQPQTFAGFELLFAHIGTFPPDVRDEWKSRLHIVQSKAPSDSKVRARFIERMNSLRDKYLSQPKTQLGTDVDPASYKDTFDVIWDQEESGASEILLEDEQPRIIAIHDDDRFRNFDPTADRDILVETSYSNSFGELVEVAREILDPLENAEGN